MSRRTGRSAKGRRSGKRTRGSTTQGPRTVKRTTSPLAKRIAAKDKAIDALGARVKPGSVSLGTSRALTPTRRGFKTLRSVSRAVQSTSKKAPKAYSFKLDVTYKTPNGKRRKLEPIEGSFPLPKAVRRQRRKGETDAKAFQRIVDTRIKQTVFRAVENAEGAGKIDSPNDPRIKRALASGDHVKIRRAIKAFKARRGISFKVTIQREVTARAASKAGAISRGTRQRGRR